MSKQTTNQVLQRKNVTQFQSYMTTNATKSITIASASLQIETYVSGGVPLGGLYRNGNAIQIRLV